MKSLWDKSGRAGLLRMRTYRKWRLLEPAEDRHFGVSSMKVEYHATMEECTAATRQALRDLDLVITGGELLPMEAHIDARSDLADVVRISINATADGGPTKVTFHAGRAWTHEGKELLRNLREAFELRLKNSTGEHP